MHAVAPSGRWGTVLLYYPREQAKPVGSIEKHCAQISTCQILKSLLANEGHRLPSSLQLIRSVGELELGKVGSAVPSCRHDFLKSGTCIKVILDCEMNLLK